jgi:hypothetical protein
MHSATMSKRQQASKGAANALLIEVLSNKPSAPAIAVSAMVTLK